MAEQLTIRCECGWETTGPEEDVVPATLEHGELIHNMSGTRDQVLERATRTKTAAVEPGTRGEAISGGT